MNERLPKIHFDIPLVSVDDQYCFKHEGNFLKTYCPSCFRDKLLGRVSTGHAPQEK